MKLNEAVILEFASDTRHLIRDALRDQGYVSRYFGSSADLARNWEDVRNALFFVIAEDIDKNGLAILRKIRAKSAIKDVPILVILGDQTEARVKEIVAVKPDGVLLRPYSMKDVASRVTAIAQAIESAS